MNENIGAETSGVAYDLPRPPPELAGSTRWSTIG